MKKLMVLMVLVSTMAFTACGQKEKVPAKVKTAFTQKFPDAKKIRWDRENAKEWEAEFKLNGKFRSANFDNEGNWKETEYKIKTAEIPAAVQQTLTKEFSGYEVEKTEVSETANGKFYEVKLEKDDTEMEIVFSTDGKVLKKEVKSEDKDEGNRDNGEEEDDD